MQANSGGAAHLPGQVVHQLSCCEVPGREADTQHTEVAASLQDQGKVMMGRRRECKLSKPEDTGQLQLLGCSMQDSRCKAGTLENCWASREQTACPIVVPAGVSC